MASVNSVRDILEVFGALDRAVREADDPDVTAAADKLIPGLGTACPTWYAELESRYFGSNARKNPNLAEALQRIADEDANPDTDRLTSAQKTRLLYGISAAQRLNSVAAKTLSALDESDAKFNDALIGSLAAIAPKGVAELKTRRDKAADASEALLQSMRSFTRTKDFTPEVREKVEASPLRSGRPMGSPLCHTAVVVVDGLESACIDTEFDSTDVSLEQLKSIVNPFNWAQDYSELFVRMVDQEPDILPDGWRRVLETVRLLGLQELTTPLKFFPYQASPLEATLDYDLDKTAMDTGDGQVLVDRGFINMKVTNDEGDPAKPGVHVTTRKVVHIQGISAYAQGKLVCIGGYGTASANFLLGAAAKPPKDPVPFDYPTNEGEADKPRTTSTAAPPATPLTHFVPAAVGAWTECAQDLTNGYFDVAQKWLSGSLTLTDLADYTTRVSGELASSPWKYLQAMTTPRTPGKPGGAK
ncbi:conserved hypothetical protein [uncultured Mycobacterium sp.]|uniref:Uncharacterized protein n=1 Tax=uncultured Mycobacterium sp. TaxID=171292 RepID=A0A1Y5P6E2_9MYCO|nr:conserved hypothetical protein [uncultured Mycobacterium sp.]